MLKKHGEAFEDIQHFIQYVNNENGESYFIRGLIEFEQNKLSAAIVDWVTALDLGHSEAEKYLQQHNLKYEQVSPRFDIFKGFQEISPELIESNSSEDADLPF